MQHEQRTVGLYTNNFQRILILLVVLFLTKAADLIIFLFQNYSIPVPPFSTFYLFYLPGFLLVVDAGLRKNLRMRNILLFLVFVVTHYSMEKLFFASSYNPNEGIDLLLRIVPMFFGYFFLINTSPQNYSFTAKMFIYAMLVNYLIVYSDLFGIIDIAELNLEFGFGGMAARLTGNYSINTIAEQGACALIFYGVLKAEGQKLFFKGKLEFLITAITFGSLVFVQSTRGGLLLLLLSLSIALLATDKSMKIANLMKFITVFVGTWVVIAILYFKVGLSIPVFERLLVVTISGDARESQITASFLNFVSSPIIGIGYKNAARFLVEGISRSNFQYTQILAAGGLILFLVYFTFIYKMFIPSLRYLKFDIISLGIVLFILLNFVSSRPEPYLGILAFVTFRRFEYFSHLNSERAKNFDNH